MRHWLRSERGDTLIEVVFAVAIMGSVLISTAALSSTAFRTGVSARERTQAANIAQGQAEALRNRRDVARDFCANAGTCEGWKKFRADISMSSPDTSSDFCLVEDGSGFWVYETNPSLCEQGQFSVWIEARQPVLSDPELIDFDITVTWNDFADGPPATTTISTVLTSHDPVVSSASGGVGGS